MVPVPSLSSLSSSSSNGKKFLPRGSWPTTGTTTSSRMTWCWFLFIAVVTILPTTVHGQCIHDLHELRKMEQQVTDTSKTRTYIICPNKEYDIGSLDYDNNLRVGRPGDDVVYPPLPLRPNLILKCGTNGLRTDQCWINSGHLQIDGTSMMGITNPTVNNVLIQGFTFIGATKHSLWVTKPGSITFRDCEWKGNTRSEGPIMLDYYNGERNDELVVTFENCHFRDNRYFGMGAQTSLIVGTSDQNRIKVAKTVFTNNDMKWNTTTETTTFLIESLGPTHIEDTCFLNNKVVSSGVAVYGNTLESARVHSSGSGGNLCAFASVFETLQQFETRKPLCISSTKAQCDLLATAPTPPPVQPVNRYVPFTINALKYDEASEKDTVLQGGCNREGTLPANGPDAQNTNDTVCLRYGGCHVSHTSAGEFLVYRFAHSKQFEVNGVVTVDVKVRMASATRKAFKLELLYNGQVSQQANLFTAGTGITSYTDITWKNVLLRATELAHSIRVNFVNGGTNFCAIGVEYSTGTGGPVFSPANPTLRPASSPVPTLRPASSPAPTKRPTLAPVALPTRAPTTGPSTGFSKVWTALEYNGFSDATPATLGSCNTRGDGVDAQPTTDSVCNTRDKSFCNIGWWDPNEYLKYRFSVPKGAAGNYKIRVRVAAGRDGKTIGIELSTTSNGVVVASSESFPVPADGLQSFNDIVWTPKVALKEVQYDVRVHSTTGGINMCSVAVVKS